jgi:hypothetical protein
LKYASVPSHIFNEGASSDKRVYIYVTLLLPNTEFNCFIAGWNYAAVPG